MACNPLGFLLGGVLRRVIAGAVVVAIVGAVWFALQVQPLGSPGRDVVVTVHPGDSMSAIAGELHAAGVIASPLAFRLDTIFGAPVVRAGSYEIARGSSFSHVKAVLGAGPNVYVLSVSPGMTIHEVVLQLAGDRGNAFANAFVAMTRSAAAASPYHPDLAPPNLAGGPVVVNPLEGLIGVGSYVITPSDTPAAVLGRLQAGFAREAASVGLAPSTTLEGLDAYQLVVAASIVEREGYYPKNMPQVARVIYNRLARGGPLQMDSTVKYALGLDAGAVTTQMLATATPYNTYLHVGLTPTPICAVSTTAMRATLHAPPGPWYYFVVINKAGDEKFSVTYAGQLAAEALARRNGVG